MNSEVVRQTAQSSDSINGIVRRFSDRINMTHPEEPLPVALAAQEAKDEEEVNKANLLSHQWQLLFIPGTMQNFETREEALLNQSSKELAAAWLKFQKNLPKEQKSEVLDGPPRLDEVFKAVNTAHTTWKAKEQSKTGKAKSLFRGLCNNLYEYKEVFAVIPDNDKYVSLLTGSLTAIVKATINYKKIADGISDCLDNLSEDICYWKRQLQIHNNNDFMKRYVAQLYVLVFQLLVDIMGWYKSGIKRVSHSFNTQSFDNIVKVKRDKMQALAQKLENEGKLATEANVQTLLASAEQMNVEEVLTRFESRIMEEFDKRLERQQGILGSSIQTTLRDEARNALWNYQAIGAKASMQQLTQSSESNASVQDGSLQIYTKVQIQASAFRLQKYRQPGLLEALTARSQGLDLNLEIFRRIRAWTNGTSTQKLWICGPFQAPTPSQYTLASAYLTSTAQKTGVPVLSYFCLRKDSRNQVEDPDERDITDITRLLYSLISQLVDLMNDAIETGLDFSTTRFATLDGSINTLPEAISLLKDLLSIRPQLLFCFIDGLQFLQRNPTKIETRALQDIIAMFHTPNENSVGSGGIIKTLYTTDGFFAPLGVLMGNERLNALDFEGEERLGRREVDRAELNLLRDM